MEVHLSTGTESRLNEVVTKTGRAADDLVEDAMAGYLAELAEVRDVLDSMASKPLRTCAVRARIAPVAAYG